MMYLWKFICEVGSFGLFPGGEDYHHFIGKAAVVILTDDFVAVKPLCYGKFFVSSPSTSQKNPKSRVPEKDHG